MDSGVDAASVRRAWDEIVRHVGQASKKAAAFAREAVVREIEGDALILVFKHKIHADGVTSDPAPLLTAVSQVIGGSWRVRCEIGGEQRGSSSARPASAPPAPSRAGKATPSGKTQASGKATPSGKTQASGKAQAGGTTARMSSAATSIATPSTIGSAAAAPSQAPAEDWPTTAKIGGAPIEDDEPPPTDEDVPYDPEFDGPAARQTHVGFDPGDEPDLDTDSLAVKQTSEEQALESLKQSFDLEKIAEKGS